jgi:hypothetical protein
MRPSSRRSNGFTVLWDRKRQQLRLSADGYVAVIGVVLAVAAVSMAVVRLWG